EANPEKEISESKRREIGKTVFIVHGHDVGLKAEVQLLLSRAGINNIVLHEQLDKGRTVIDKLIQEGSDAGYAIALLTPDDSQLDGGKRARQNVVLELGYFMGRLGKERVRMLLKGGIEMPTDLSGVLYERYDRAWGGRLNC
ncbi:MAG: nucleotide-binding protein, partial [Flavobacteriales bacterium]|nr:nucleotide-binding protein [Flavobacteriales bacterium]